MGAAVAHTGGLSGAVDVPSLALRAWRGGRARNGTVHYDEAEHRRLPHVVKFSGGRSSGLMLLLLLRNGLLRAERGDVVLFTNTSAEHPATYDFVGKMKRATEREGVPFLIAQWQTVETVFDGEWRRRPTYRLVNARPLSAANPDGYCHRGEVFEEAVAWGGMLPSVHTRVCTTLMKMLVTREFLADWLAARTHLPEQGHDAGSPKTDPREAHRIHRANRGTLSRAEIEARWEFLSRRPTGRPRQHLGDFTRARLPAGVNDLVSHSVFGGRCHLFGEIPAPFLTFLGFRAGEDSRHQRMVRRNLGEHTPGHGTQPPGEHSYAPLFSLGIDQEQVLRFWGRQPGRLRPHLPEDLNLSNCVYCFLKGPRALAEIERGRREFERKLPGGIRAECRKHKTPNSLAWWADIEERYGRGSRKRGANGAQPFGMFGLRDMSYRKIGAAATRRGRNGRATVIELREDPTLSCECTD